MNRFIDHIILRELTKCLLLKQGLDSASQEPFNVNSMVKQGRVIMPAFKKFFFFLGHLIVKDGKFSPLFMPFLAFALSIVSAFIINAFIQNSIIERQEKFVINRRNLDQAEQTLVNVSNLVNERISGLKKIQSALEHGARQSVLEKSWAAYEEARTSWEVKDMAYRFKLNTYYSTDLACDFWQGIDRKSVSECCKNCVTLFDSFEQADKSMYAWEKCQGHTNSINRSVQNAKVSKQSRTKYRES